MKISHKLFRKQNALLAAAVLGLSCAASAYLPGQMEAAGYSAPKEQAIKVLPIDNAKFLQGQKFDFTIEVKNAAQPTMQVDRKSVV